MVLFGLTVLSCNDYKNESTNLNEIKKLQAEKDSLKTIITQNRTSMENQMIRSLTFQDGNAENAMNFYVELFDNSKIITLNRWGDGAPVAEGKIMQATFELNGNLFMCSDSPPVHDWDFSPAVSNYIDCKDEEEMDRLFSKLSENGKVTMGLANYGFSQKFGWVIDQFGVSWQLNLK
ncbi:putative 3-demethylubiquinone-9 3-methyltransferase (glyoxalase superfamily) [Flagellimonas meridianipacifica]|uniref:Putative 3-demethylubiquinone-9 3-methyltransferase (Glyoxalase superfamily) n=1 Tax=Flagellimonas meridianipacifica TaxID=1080225 RepID=A0A2T0MB06_9FLAO|nr:putative 3-demethylubiquinone-9 3-methyltransferase (glyoxalase superfamily) [Allomuricauda pacifica]